MSVPDFIRTEWRSKGCVEMTFLPSDQRSDQSSNASSEVDESQYNFGSNSNSVHCYLSTFNIWEFKEDEELSDNMNVTKSIEGKFITDTETLPPSLDWNTWTTWLQHWSQWKDTYVGLSWVKRFRQYCNEETISWYENYLLEYPQTVSYIEFCENLDLKSEKELENLYSRNDEVAPKVDIEEDSYISNDTETFESESDTSDMNITPTIDPDHVSDMNITPTIDPGHVSTLDVSNLKSEEFFKKPKSNSQTKKDFKTEKEKILDKMYEELLFQRHWVHCRLYLNDIQYQVNDELRNFFISHQICMEPNKTLEICEYGNLNLESHADPVKDMEMESNLDPTGYVNVESILDHSNNMDEECILNSNKNIDTDSNLDSTNNLENGSNLEYTKSIENKSNLHPTKNMEIESDLDTMKKRNGSCILDPTQEINGESILVDTKKVDKDYEFTPTKNVEIQSSLDHKNVKAESHLVPTNNVESESDLDISRNLKAESYLDPTKNIETKSDLDPTKSMEAESYLDPTKNVETESYLDPTMNVEAECDLDSAKNRETESNLDPTKNVQTESGLDPTKNVETDSDLDPTKKMEIESDLDPMKNVEAKSDLDPTKNIETESCLYPTKNIESDLFPTKNIEAESDLDPTKNVEAESDLDPTKNVEAQYDVDPTKIIETEFNLDPTKTVEAESGLDPTKNIQSESDLVPTKNIEAESDLDPTKNIEAESDLDPTKNVEAESGLDSTKNIEAESVLDPTKNIETESDLDPTKNIKVKFTDTAENIVDMKIVKDPEILNLNTNNDTSLKNSTNFYKYEITDVNSEDQIDSVNGKCNQETKIKVGNGHIRTNGSAFTSSYLPSSNLETQQLAPDYDNSSFTETDCKINEDELKENLCKSTKVLSEFNLVHNSNSILGQNRILSNGISKTAETNSIVKDTAHTQISTVDHEPLQEDKRKLPLKADGSVKSKKKHKKQSTGIAWAMKHLHSLNKDTETTASTGELPFVFGSEEKQSGFDLSLGDKPDETLAETDRSPSHKRKHSVLNESWELATLGDSDEVTSEVTPRSVILTMSRTVFGVVSCFGFMIKDICEFIAGRIVGMLFKGRSGHHSGRTFLPHFWNATYWGVSEREKNRRIEISAMKQMKKIFYPTLKKLPFSDRPLDNRPSLSTVKKCSDNRAVVENLVQVSREESLDSSVCKNLSAEGIYVTYMTEEDVDDVLSSRIELTPVCQEDPSHRTITYFDDDGLPKEVLRVPTEEAKAKCVSQRDYDYPGQAESKIDGDFELVADSVAFDADGNPVLMENSEFLQQLDEDRTKQDVWHQKLNKVLSRSNLMRFHKTGDFQHPDDVPFEARKYWIQRFRLFLRYDEGIKLDYESWYSVTPEMISAHQAERLACDVVVDAFCGAGGNAIQLAATCSKVIAIDLDPSKIELARNNAKVYGVDHRIEFIVGDFFTIAPSLKADGVLLSPPWGGIDYLGTDTYDVFKLNDQMDGEKVFRTALKISSNLALYLPKNSDVIQICQLARLLPGEPRVDIEFSHISNKRKGLTAYFGDLVDFSSE